MDLELDPPPPEPPAPPRVGPPAVPPAPPEVPGRHRPTFPRSLAASVAIHAALFLLLAWWIGSPPPPAETAVTFHLRLDPSPEASDPEAEPGGDAPRTETPDDAPAEEASDPEDWLSDADDAVAEDEWAADAPQRIDVPVGLAAGGVDARRSRAAWEGRLGGREALLREGGGDDSTEGALHRALAWLARHQSADGTWSARDFPKRCRDRPCGGAAENDYVEATTALGLLPFLGAGNTHAEGKWRATVRRGVRALVGRQKDDGSWGTDPRRAYATAMATLALAEDYGMTGSPQLREPAQRAVDFWARTQSGSGGWRYAPGDGEADSSVTGWVAVALVGARRAGLDVPQRTMLGCRAWFQSRTSPDGSVGYTLPGSGTASMLGTGLFVETLLGSDAASPRLRATADQLAHRLPRLPASERDPAAEFGPADPMHWFYGGLAAFQRGGDLWTVWELRLRDTLLPSQERDGDLAGSWPPLGATGRAGGRVVTTALCALALEVYYRYPRVTMTAR